MELLNDGTVIREESLSDRSEAPGLLASYMARISRGELLSHQEEAALSRRVHAGDGRARNRLIEKNLRMVVSVPKRYRGAAGSASSRTGAI